MSHYWRDFFSHGGPERHNPPPRRTNRDQRQNVSGVSDGTAGQQHQNMQMVQNLGEEEEVVYIYESVPSRFGVPPLLHQPSTSAAGVTARRQHGGGFQRVTPATSAPPITFRLPQLEQLLELLNQLEQVDREVEAFSGGASGGAFRGLEERLVRLLCAVDGVEVGRQQALRDLQKHANTSITKSMRLLERKAGVVTVEDEPSYTTLKEVKKERTALNGSAENGPVEEEQPGGEEFEEMWVLKEGSQENEPIDSETAVNELVPLVTRGAEGELVLEEEALRRVVCRPEVRHRLLAIVSVVGPPRSGKSLLLNLMRDYLAAKGESGWLKDENSGINYVNMPPSSQTEDGAPELDETRPRAEMLLWAEPFVISDDLAVILVESVLTEDTQAFALSTLVSSLQVINITAESFTWPGTDLLQFLRDFCLDMTRSLGDKTLQRCVALLRDDARELRGGPEVYGLPGGAHLFDKWLLDLYDLCPSKKKLMSMVHASYQQFASFARPPNFKTEQEIVGIQGSTTHWLPGPLAKHLVEWLLQPSRLPPKLLGQRELRAHELPSLLACLVQELQQPDLSAAGLVTALARTEHERFHRLALQVYKQQVLDRLDTAQDPAELHSSVVERVLNHVDQHKIFGGSDLAAKYRSLLVEELGVQYETAIAPCVVERESTRQNQVKQAAEFAMTYYQTEILSKRPWDVSRSLRDVSEVVVQQAVAKFLEKAGDKITPEEQDKRVNKLKRKAEMQCEVLMLEYKTWRSAEGKRQTQARLEQGYQRALQVYRAEMEPDLSEQVELEQQHQQAARNALAELRNTFPGGDSEMDMSQLISKLGEEMKVLRKEYEHTKEQQRKNKKDELENFKNLAVKTFETEANACLKDIEDKTKLPITREALTALLDAAKHRAMDLFEPLRQQGSGEEEYQSFVDSAAGTIQALRAACEETWEGRVRAELQKASDSCIESYKTNMQNFLEDGPSQEAMAQKKDDMVVIVWKFFPKEVQVYGDELCKIFIDNTIQILKEKHQEFIEQLEKRQKMDLVDVVLHDFDKSFKQLSPASTSRATLDEHYTHAKAAALSKIREALKDSPQLEEDLERAEEHMQETLADVRKRIEEENKEEVAYEDALATYTAEMGDLLECARIPSNYTVRTLHTSAHKQAIDSYMAVAAAGDSKRDKLNKFLKKLEEDIAIEFDNVSSQIAIQHRDERIEADEDNRINYAIGIDLGTTFSCASVYKDGKVQPIVNKDKKHTTPSVVYFGQHGVLVGEEAKFKGFEDPENCISEVKRIIGRTFDDPVVQSVTKQWAFKVASESNRPQIQVAHGDKKSYAPEEVSALLLKELKHQAEVKLGSAVHDAVVTIPAYFTEPQRDATLRACKEAGLNVLRLLNEPTAAAMAYGLQTLTEEDQENNTEVKCHRVLVFDFGGGTCDVSILELRGSHFVVKASQGDNQLGGEDYDDRLTKHIIDKLEKKTPGLTLEPKSCRRLRYMAEIAKCRLTDNRDFQIYLPNFPKLGEELDETVHRNVFEEITLDLSERALKPVGKCLEEAGLSKDDIELVVLAGGSSRIPKVQQLLREFFPGKPLYDGINPDEAIACGAALQAALFTGECQHVMRITDITPFSLGVGAVRRNNVSNLYDIIIKKNSQIPCSSTSRRFTVYDNQLSMGLPVYQGENTEDEFKNTLLGKFKLENLTPAPAGKTKADVTFRIDVNGILHVTAEEVRRGGSNKKSITITKRVNM